MKSRALFLSALLFLALTSVLTGCDKDKDLPPPVLERSYVHIQSVTEMVDSFDITFDYWNVDDVVISNFFWNRNWPMAGYANLLEGGQPDEFGNGQLYVTATRQPFFGGAIDTLAGPITIVLDPADRQSIYVGDSAGKAFFLVLQDEFTTSAGTTALRFVNLRSNTPVATLRSVGGAITLPATNFGAASTFTNVPSGVYDFEAVDAGGSVVATITNVSLYDGGTSTMTLSRPSAGALSTWSY
jgi:hypothetical protein